MLVNKANNTPKRSLILAGGGMRVAYQAGVLVALEESGINFSHVDGTSGGIFNAAMLASGLSPREMAQRWRTLKVKHFVSGRKIKAYLKPFSMTGYADADNIRTKVFPHLGIDIQKIQNNPATNATFNLCNFSEKTVEAISNKGATEDHLIAGVSLPLMMPALQIGTDWYTDAVWIKDAHLMEAVRQESEELWLVWAIGNSHSYHPGAFNQYVHMIEMSANGALLEEFDQIKLINEMILTGAGNFKQKNLIRVFVLKSPIPLPLDPDLFFDKISTRELINMGYDQAKTFLAASPVPDSKMDQQATKNILPGTDLRFRAVFTGDLLEGNLRTEIVYHTCFQFNCVEEVCSLHFFSSIYLGNSAEEISTYGHSIRCTKENDYSRLEVTSKLLVQAEEHCLTAVFILDSPIDFLIGLEMKRCAISIANQEGIYIKGDLHQSISHRLKACYSSNLRTAAGKSGSIRHKFRMVSKLMEYEV